MFRTRIIWAFGILAVASIIQGVLGWSALRVADQNIQRGRVANDLLSGFVDLATQKNRLRILLSESHLGRPVNQDELSSTHQQMLDTLQQLDSLGQKAIALDIDHRETEAEHAERLRALELLRTGVVRIGEQMPRFVVHAESAPGLNWQSIDEVFDMAAGQDLRNLLAASISRERLATARDRTAADTAIKLLNQLAITATVTLSAVAALLALYFLRALTKPLERIAEGARALESGDLSFRIPEDSNDEFSRLAMAVNNMARDLTEFRGRELAAREELENLVQERTAEVQEGLHRLEKLDLRRRQMFADISHELKTPTTAIRGEAEIMLRGRDKAVEEYKDSLHRILDSSQNLGMVIEDMLTLSRTDIDSLVFDRRPLVLRDALMESVSQIQALCKKKQIQVQVDLNDQGLILGDKQRLKQLFVIVLDNAVQYSHSESVISVSSREIVDEEQNSLCQVQICDHGIGIPEQEQDRVWNRHFRGERAKQIRADGQGLGLALASAITRAHFGVIHLSSEVNKGTCVTIEIPIVERTDEKQA